jgi:hypothetical protein
MHYHVIQRATKTGTLAYVLQVEVIEGDRKAVYCFGGRSFLQVF